MHRRPAGPSRSSRRSCPPGNHRSEIAGREFRDLLVIAVKITHDRLEFYNGLAIERHVHAKDAVRTRMLRADADLKLLRLHRAVDGVESGAAGLSNICEGLDHF